MKNLQPMPQHEDAKGSPEDFEFLNIRVAKQTAIVYGLVVALAIMTFLLGMKGVALTRPLFICGCVALGWRAYRASMGLHVEVVIVLLAFAPFLRRIVDVNAGFDANGIMLVGPLLAIAIPLINLKELFVSNHQFNGVFIPYIIMGACLIYGWSISAFQGEIVDATIVGAKLFLPVLYAIVIIQNFKECDAILQSFMRAFIIITPIMCIYGIAQYMAPQPWDRYWMLNSPLLTSIGKPEAMQVRVFATMNAPANFGTFVSCGLLFYGFCQRRLGSLLFIAPILIGLLLSLYRTAWIAVAISMIFCLFFNSTRGRAFQFITLLFFVGAVAILVTPFGPELSDRLMTLTGDPAQDGSGHERLHEYVHLYTDQSRYIFGNGLSGKVMADPDMLGIDGQPIASAFVMGIFVGNIHLLSFIWACLQSVFPTRKSASPIWLVAGAFVLGNVFVLPLVAIAGGEMSVPVWILVALLSARQQCRASTRPGKILPKSAMSPGLVACGP